MTSEIFNLKSLPTDDTVIRGARIGQKNARTTKTISVGNEEDVKSGEKNVNADFVIRSSLIGNDLQGYGTFTHDSAIVSGYTGPQGLNNGDKIRFQTDVSFYTVTGLEGTNLYLTSKYQGETGGTGVCTIRKVKLNSVEYEIAHATGISTPIIYDKNKNEWGVTGINLFTGPYVAPSGATGIDTGMDIQFLPGAAQSSPDLMTVNTVYKTLTKNNSNPISDLSLSPIPYPHESLKVYWGKADGTLEEKTEFVPGSSSFSGNYIVNYSQDPTLMWPRPPYVERQVAYIKFLDDLVDETQVASIDATFEGSFAVTKASELADAPAVSVQNIIPESDSVKIGTTELERNKDYIINTNAGIVTLVSHEYQEELIDTVTYPKRLMWDGVSIIRGVGADDLANPDIDNNTNLVIPGFTGLAGITGIIYFEDVDENNLVRDADYNLEFNSGAVRISQTIGEDEAYLASFYVEGEDEEKERVTSDHLRTSKYPILRDTLIMTKRQDSTTSGGVVVMIEGEDFDISYLTGYITIYDTDLLEQPKFSVEVTYTPLAQVNCILQQNPADDTYYKMTIVDDHLKLIGDPSTYTYEVENPKVSVLKTDYFKRENDPARYSYEGSITDSDFLYMRDGTDDDILLDTTGYKYDDTKRQIVLDPAVNNAIPSDIDDILATYNVVSDALPYAPIQVIFPLIEQGSDTIVFEGFDRTDVLKVGKLLRIDNFDPVATYYFRTKTANYVNGSTVVTFYGTFPEDIRIPTFYTFDDNVSWQDLPSGTEVNRSALKGSTSLLFRGVTLDFVELVRTNSLLLVNDQDVYTVTSVETSDTEALVNIFPKLLNPVTGDIVSSRLPMIAEDTEILHPKKFVLIDPEQPAFTVWYQPPVDNQGTTLFEGNGTLVITNESLILYEYIEGIENPSPYVFTLSSYASTRDLVNAIKTTKSTFNQNVNILPDVPEYYPFTTFPNHVSQELYYLPDGNWDPTLIVPFVQGVTQDLPYTATLVQDLKRRDILEVFKSSSTFDVQEIDRTDLFQVADLLAFRDTLTSELYFYEVSGSVYADGDTTVSLTDSFRVNMLGPQLYRVSGVPWINEENTILSIDRSESTVTFSGVPDPAVVPGSLYKFDNKYVYSVAGLTTQSSSYTVAFVPALVDSVTSQNFEGYVKHSAYPILMDEPSPAPTDVVWTILTDINERRLVPGTDYEVVNGALSLTRPVQRLERYRLNYMGLDRHAEDEGSAISCTCKFFTELTSGSQVDVYMDYLNIDQFYLQKLTEERFLEIVTVPQITEILNQKGGSGGQSADTGATDGSTPVYEGGLADRYYRLRDEQIKKQLYLRIYKWYKARLRNFSSELQLTMGFKFANSNAVGTRNGHYTLLDAYVEDSDYTLTTDADIRQVQNGFSKFFPVGYEGSAPLYYDRFATEYKTYNEAYCYNINYYDSNLQFVKTEGRVKSVNPYWSQGTDYQILNNTNDNLVASYEQPIPEDERTFNADDPDYSWLKRLNVGDELSIYGYEEFYEIGSFSTGTDTQSSKPYDVAVLKDGSKFTQRGVKTYNIVYNSQGVPYFLKSLAQPLDLRFGSSNARTMAQFEASLNGEGYNLLIKKQQLEQFPMYDDEFNYGRKIEGGTVEGHVRDKDRIKKFSLADLLGLLFGLPIAELPKNVRVQVGRYDEETLAFTVTDNIIINLAELNFFEERKISTTEDALYQNYREDVSEALKGLDQYFYLSFERIYDDQERRGYREGYVLRTKDRNIWFRFLTGGENDVAEEYGFTDSTLYKNFYSPDNMYRYLILEKQAWETEEAIVKDLYDYNDKLARAFNEGEVNIARVSTYKGYLAKYLSSAPPGISDWIAARMAKYAPQLAFFLGGYTYDGDPGPLEGILKPDGVHDEDDATAAIAKTFEDTTDAKNTYAQFYNKFLAYYGLNASNNETWKYDYIRWVLSLEEGLMYQKDARTLYDTTGKLEIGTRELDALRFAKAVGSTYDYSSASFAVSAAVFSITVTLSNGTRVYPGLTYSYELLDATGEYKTLDTLSGEINAQLFRGEAIFRSEVTFEHYPYGAQSTEVLLRGTQTADMSGWVNVYLTNVADHRVADPRILYLNKQLEDSVPLDYTLLQNRAGYTGAPDSNNVANPVGVWPVYTANGNINKKAIEGLPVAGKWETLNEDVFNVMQVRCIGAPATIEFSDMDGEDYKAYMGNSTIIKQIDEVGIITPIQLAHLKASVVSNKPQVTQLKKMIMTRHGVADVSIEYNLREYATVNDLVEAINSTRFDTNGEIDPTGNIQYFEARLLGTPEDQGETKSYEMCADYEPVTKSFYVGKLAETGAAASAQENLNKFEQIISGETGVFVSSEYYGVTGVIFYHLDDQVVGWTLTKDTSSLGGSVTFQTAEQRYSLFETANFLIDDPAFARTRTLRTFPKGLSKDILAFDIYCWDEENESGQRYYEIKDNWIYFVSANVDNYGIPLASSGDSRAPDNESLADLLNRINTDGAVNKYFYANLKFTRESRVNPGYYEYTYLPDLKIDVPKSELDSLYLRQDAALSLYDSEDAEYQIVPNGAFDPLDTVSTYTSTTLNIRSDVRAISVAPGTGYTFTSSSIAIDDTLDTLTLSATWVYDYSYQKTFYFSDTSYDTIQELVNAINAETVPYYGTQMFDAVLLSNDDSTELLAASGSLTLAYVTLNKDGPINAFKLRMNTTGAPGFSIPTRAYQITAARDRLVLTCTIQYTGTYNPPVYDISSGNYTLQALTDSIGLLKPIAHAIFPYIFNSSVYNLEYALDDASSLEDLTSSITAATYGKVPFTKSYSLMGSSLATVSAQVNADTVESGVSSTYVSSYGTYEAGYLRPVPVYTTIVSTVTVDMDLRQVVGIRLLNMDSSGVAEVNTNSLLVRSEGEYNVSLPAVDTPLATWVESIRGDALSGMLSITVLPIAVDSSPYGLLNERASFALHDNDKAHVYFGVMGDIKWIQISDYNLYTQLNYIKERLAQPWKDAEGQVLPDYYTPEQYNANNPYAIDEENFLNWLRSTRYSQIRSNMLNEATVSNKYLWLYMKFHREFGCDQQVKLIERQIATNETDQEILGNAQ